MKRFKFLLILSLSLSMFSCSEDFLGKDSRDDVSGSQIQDLANSSPEAAFTITSGIESGNNIFVNDFNTAGNGNIHDDFGHMSINLGLDLMSNDMVQFQSHWFVNYYNYTARNENSIRTDMVWKFYYKVIYNMNSILRFLPENISDNELRYLKARCLAMRGLSYFNLIRIYGNGNQGIPMYTETILDETRVPTSTILGLIEDDLTRAYDLIDGYSRPSKVNIDENVVAGLLARYYLEYGDYSQAASYAAIARSGYVPMNNLFDGFNKITNDEWMWGADLNTNTSTYYASYFSHIGNSNAGYAGLLGIYKNVDRRLYDAISSTDQRRSWFDGPSQGLPMYANTKFFDDTDFEGDYVFMRAAEMYLIEAEARAENGDEVGARQVLFDLISTRDASYTLSTNSGNALIEEIRTHRRIELWGEGFAFYDMKRWGKDLERNYSGSNHTSFGFFNYPVGSPKFTFQIPLSEINANPSLGGQNPF